MGTSDSEQSPSALRSAVATSSAVAALAAMAAVAAADLGEARLSASVCDSSGVDVTDGGPAPPLG